MQGHGFAPSKRAHRNAITHRRRELLQWAALFQVESGLLGIFDQHTGAHQGASNSPRKGIEQAFNLALRRCRRTVELGRAIAEGVGAVEHQQVNIQIQRRSKALNEGHKPGLGAGAGPAAKTRALDHRRR